ncbi:MAG: PEPxxWA-CTERM sorting domain-containing protein [Phenylobacterium sp.]|nr:PEPxxWA-CTERM sorting domain-containing protein [Phenylobacterium sp.]
MRGAFRTAAAAAVALLAAVAGTAHAGVSIHTDEAAFAGAVGALAVPLLVESFETQPGNGPGLPASTGAPIAFDGGVVDCTLDACSRFFVTTLYHTDGSQGLYARTGGLTRFTFDAPVNAFAIDLVDFGDTLMSAGSTLIVTLDGVAFEVFADFVGADLNRLFVGVTSDRAFRVVSFSGSVAQDDLVFDRLQFGRAAAAPEPGAWGLMILGFAACGAALRRRGGPSHMVASGRKALS